MIQQLCNKIEVHEDVQINDWILEEEASYQKQQQDKNDPDDPPINGSDGTSDENDGGANTLR
ncbi:hypothetical protein [Aneurinibacillus terranovensis]|uniref:hypothetical protein n=1 Tax=Aneurinibacillus terranovensis TaxID=278991 RepID=UPI001B7F8FC4